MSKTRVIVLVVLLGVIAALFMRCETRPNKMGATQMYMLERQAAALSQEGALAALPRETAPMVLPQEVTPAETVVELTAAETRAIVDSLSRHAKEGDEDRALKIDYAQFGICSPNVQALLAKGGMFARITGISQDRNNPYELDSVVYQHKFGTATTAYFGSENKNDPVASLIELEEARQHMDEEERAMRQGVMWYMVVNRAAIPGLPPVFVDSQDPNKTTKWREYVVHVSKGVCNFESLDIAIYEQDLPKAVRNRLK